MAREYNFDGLVGPTHNYGGLSFGNVASEAHAGHLSEPRRAALQGLEKMRRLHALGVPQAVLPPHLRPELGLARRLGFSGSDAEVLEKVAREVPLLLAALYSASAMWTANAATVCPSADAPDGRVHFTPANLQNKIHRHIEAPTTARVLAAIFADQRHFVHHEPLPGTAALGDEGAANHTRLAPAHGARGVQLFVFGESAANPWAPRPKVFPARQTEEACRALRRLHGVPPEATVVAQQNPDAIDQGVFHADVILVGDRDLLFVHEEAFLEPAAVLQELREKYRDVTGGALRTVVVPKERVTVADAVSTYLFNSQLVALPGGRTALIAPEEVAEHHGVREYVRELTGPEGPFQEVHTVDLRQSMQGGGGPACLRLRVVLTEEEERSMAPGVRFTEELYLALVALVERRYRETLTLDDLRDPALLEECKQTLDELTRLLGLGAVYEFQR